MAEEKVPVSMGPYTFEGYEPDEMNKKIELLNVVFPLDGRWVWTRAAKDHFDAFGAKINDGEYYLKQRRGRAFDDVLKMSVASMTRLLFLLTEDHSRFDAIMEVMKNVEGKSTEELRGQAGSALTKK